MQFNNLIFKIAAQLVLAALIQVIYFDLAFAQPAPLQRVPAQIDWQAANKEKEVALSVPATRTRAANAQANFGSNLDNVAMPVLVIGKENVRSSSPRLQHQETSYAVSYKVDKDVELSILGTATAINIPNDSVLAKKSKKPKTNYQFDVLEDASDLSFSKFGANYTIRISCKNPKDHRCTESSFLRSIADSLVPVGGRPR